MIQPADDEAEAVAAMESIHGLWGCVGERILPGRKMEKEVKERCTTASRRSWLRYLELLYFQVHSGAQLMMIFDYIGLKRAIEAP